MNRRVVITGVSVHTVIGSQKEEFWKNLIEGKSGIGELDIIDVSQYSKKNGGQIRNQDFLNQIPKNIRGQIGECAQYALAVSMDALKDSGIKLEKSIREKMGVSFGTTEGEVLALKKIDDAIYGEKSTDDSEIAEWIQNYPCHNIPMCIANALELEGDVIINSNACAAANYSVGYMYDLVKQGKLDYAIAGGADVFSRVAFTGFSRLLAVSPDYCRPFDQDRQGMMVSEGSAAVILETLDSALARKAHIYGEILGYGISNDAYHMTTPHPEAEGVLNAINSALDSSNLSIEDIDYISLHGTGTKANDNAEMLALDKLFEGKSSNICASSIKGALGHAMGAASAIELVTCALILDRGIVPPTINVRTVDKKCQFNLICNKAEKKDIRILMNNAYAFGGSNSCVILKKIEE